MMSGWQLVLKISRRGAIVLGVVWLAQGLVLPAVALASPNRRGRSVLTYVPPNRGTPTRGIRGAGSRGCSLPGVASESISLNAATGQPRSALLASMTLLVPSDHIGQTADSHPSFYWYIPDVPPVPMEFTLVEPGVPEPLLVQQVTVTKSGVVGVKLPVDKPGLAVGKRYRWSVALICNTDRRSNDVFAQSWIERVDGEAVNQQALTVDPVQQVALYASAGLWYDALRSASDNLVPAGDALQDLLDQAGLADIAPLIGQ